MTTKPIIKSIARKTGISEKKAQNMLEAYVQAVNEEISKGNPVAIKGFGTFELSELAEKKMYNPSNGKYKVIPKRTTLKFKPSTQYKKLFKGTSEN